MFSGNRTVFLVSFRWRQSMKGVSIPHVRHESRLPFFIIVDRESAKSFQFEAYWLLGYTFLNFQIITWWIIRNSTSMRRKSQVTSYTKLRVNDKCPAANGYITIYPLFLGWNHIQFTGSQCGNSGNMERHSFSSIITVTRKYQGIFMVFWSKISFADSFNIEN